jgi:hypothetical protein
MKVQEVLLRAIAKKITWWQAAEILGVTDRTMRRWRERVEAVVTRVWRTGARVKRAAEGCHSQQSSRYYGASPSTATCQKSRSASTRVTTCSLKDAPDQKVYTA